MEGASSPSPSQSKLKPNTQPARSALFILDCIKINDSSQPNEAHKNRERTTLLMYGDYETTGFRTGDWVCISNPFETLHTVAMVTMTGTPNTRKPEFPEDIYRTVEVYPINQLALQVAFGSPVFIKPMRPTDLPIARYLTVGWYTGVSQPTPTEIILVKTMLTLSLVDFTPCELGARYTIPGSLREIFNGHANASTNSVSGDEKGDQKIMKTTKPTANTGIIFYIMSLRGHDHRFELAVCHQKFTQIRLAFYCPSTTRSWQPIVDSHTISIQKALSTKNNWFDNGMKSLFQSYTTLQDMSLEQLQTFNVEARNQLHHFGTCFRCCKINTETPYVCPECRGVTFCSHACYMESRIDAPTERYFMVAATIGLRIHTQADCQTMKRRVALLYKILPVSMDLPQAVPPFQGLPKLAIDKLQTLGMCQPSSNDDDDEDTPQPEKSVHTQIKTKVKQMMTNRQTNEKDLCTDCGKPCSSHPSHTKNNAQKKLAKKYMQMKLSQTLATKETKEKKERQPPVHVLTQTSRDVPLAENLIRNTWLLRYDIPPSLAVFIDHFNVHRQYTHEILPLRCPLWLSVVDQRLEDDINVQKQWKNQKLVETIRYHDIILQAQFRGEFKPVEQWNSNRKNMSCIRGLLDLYTSMSDEEKWNIYLIVLTFGYIITFLSFPNQDYILRHTSTFQQSILAYPWLKKSNSEVHMCRRCGLRANRLSCHCCFWSITSSFDLCVVCEPHTRVMCIHFSLLNQLFSKWFMFTYGQFVMPTHVLTQYDRFEAQFPVINSACIIREMLNVAFGFNRYFDDDDEKKRVSLSILKEQKTTSSGLIPVKIYITQVILSFLDEMNTLFDFEFDPVVDSKNSKDRKNPNNSTPPLPSSL